MLRVLLLSIAACAVTNAQSAMTIVTKDSSVALTDAAVLMSSSKGYLMGSSYQDFRGVYVTDPVIPPKGVDRKSVV